MIWPGNKCYHKGIRLKILYQETKWNKWHRVNNESRKSKFNVRFRSWFCRHVNSFMFFFSEIAARICTCASNVVKLVCKYPELLMPTWLISKTKLPMREKIVIKKSLPYCGHGNKGPPESIPRTFDKRTRKLLTVPVRVLSVHEKKNRITVAMKRLTWKMDRL